MATTTYFFCLAHLAEFRRVYDYSWDKGTGGMGYYRGKRRGSVINFLEYGKT